MSIKKTTSKGRTFWIVDATDGHGHRIRRRLEYREAAIELDKDVAISRVKNEAYASPLNRITFGELVDEYAARPALEFPLKDPDKRIRELKNISQRIGPKTLVQTMGGKYFDDYRRRRLSGYFGGPVTDATVNRDLAYLATIFKWALYRDIITEIPLQGALRGKEARPRDIVCTPAEFGLILAAIAPYARIPLLLFYLLPFRRSEVLTLTWEQVDFTENGAFLIPEGISKSGRPRAIHFYYPFLKSIMQEIPSRFAGGPVFTHREKPISDKFTTYYTARAKVGLDHIRVHDLRHTAITNLRLSGVPDIDMIYASDHSSPFMQARYTNLTREDYLQHRRWHYNPETNLLIPHPGTELYSWEQVA